MPYFSLVAIAKKLSKDCDRCRTLSDTHFFFFFTVRVAVPYETFCWRIQMHLNKSARNFDFHVTSQESLGGLSVEYVV